MLKYRTNFKLRNALAEKVEKLIKNTGSSETIGLDQIAAIFLKGRDPFIVIHLSEIINL